MMLANSPLRRSLVALLTCTLLVACDAPAATPTPTAPSIKVTLVQTPTAVKIEPTATATPAATATPKPPQIVTIPISETIDTLHPFYARSTSAQAVLAALYVGCVGENEHDQPVALGCEQVPTLDNGAAQFIGEGLDRYLEVTFKIRAGWRWTDGTAVTAQDALFAWQTIMSPESNLRDGLTQKIYTMAAPDAHTIVVNFMSAAQARAAAAGLLTGDVAFEYFSQLGDYVRYARQDSPLADPQYWAAVRWLPAHLLKDVPIKDQVNSPFAAQPIGDGAFELVKVTPKNVKLRRAAQPFPLGAAALEGVEFIAPDALPAQPPSLSVTLPAEESPAADSDSLISFDGDTLEQVLLNVDRPPFDEIKVRQAVAHAIDHARLLQEVGPLSAFSPVTPALPYDPQKSAALLAEAGWDCSSKPCRKSVSTARGVAISQTLEFTLVTSERAPRNIVAQSIQRQLAEAGFAVNVQIVFGLGAQSKLFASYANGGILLTRNFDAALYRAPRSEALRGAFDCASIPNERQNDAGQGNASGYCDDKLDQLIALSESSDQTLTPATRAATLAEATQALDNAAPRIKLYIPHQVVHSHGIGGLKPSAHLPITWNIWEWAVAATLK